MTSQEIINLAKQVTFEYGHDYQAVAAASFVAQMVCERERDASESRFYEVQADILHALRTRHHNGKRSA